MKPLWFRRRPSPELVRETLREYPPLDPPLIQSFFGEVIVSLRGDIQKALDALARGDATLARDILESALERNQ